MTPEPPGAPLDGDGTAEVPATAGGEETRLAGLRARTPELELLISGAVLFALFRLSDAADEAFFARVVNLGGTLRMVAVIAFEYVKLILYSLIAAFVTHLAARAWWVGLIGIDAAFPQGPRWETLRYGPAMMEAYRRQVRPLRRSIVAADAFASIVFSTGMAFALMFAISVVGSTAIAAAAWLLAQAVPTLDAETAFLVVAGVVVAALLSVSLVDKLFGERLLGSPRRAGMLRRAANTVAAVSGVGIFGPVTFAISSHLPKRRVYTAFVGGILLVLGMFIVRDVLVGFGLLDLHSHRFLPGRPGAAGFDPDYYESYRKPHGFEWTLPSLPGEIVVGPYVRLFVPLSPDRVERAVRQRCPGVAPVRDAGLAAEPRAGAQTAEQAAAVESLRQCLAGTVVVELDGEPVPPASSIVGVHPTSGARGLLTYLPTAGLAPGQHRLVVRETRLADDEREPRVHHLPFWR